MDSEAADGPIGRHVDWHVCTDAQQRSAPRLSNGAASLQGVLVVPDLIEPEFALEFPVLPGIRWQRGAMQFLRSKNLFLVDTGLGQLLLRFRRLESDNSRLICKPLDVSSRFLKPISYDAAAHLSQGCAVLLK